MSNNKRKSYYPKTNKPRNKRNNNNKGVIKYNNKTSSMFKGNDMFHSKSFDNRGEELSGYVERELIQIDRHGNKQIAREKQFINSGRNMDIKINKERNKRYCG